MDRTVDTNSMNPSDKNSDTGWTTIPVKRKLVVSFPKHPGQATLHMLLLNSYFPTRPDKWIWHCYLDDEVLSPNPRGRERYTRIQKAFTKSGTFFAEHGIVLHSLNICTPRIVELFFGSEEDLWKADALAREYSQAMTGVGDRIRRKENVGKMVCHGVYFLEQFTDEFVRQWDLKEERLRELEDMNPVFDSHGKRVLYRIRYVHYMSSQVSNERLLRAGATWAVTFSDFRVAECFIDGHAEFNFFMDPCAGGLSWYQDNPSRFDPSTKSFTRTSVSSRAGGSIPGIVAIPNTTTTAAAPSGANNLVEKKLEGLVIIETPEQAESKLNVKKTKNSADAESTSTDQQKSEFQSLTTAATTSRVGQAGIVMPRVHMRTSTVTKQAPKHPAVKTDTMEQQNPQLSERLSENITSPTPAPISPAAMDMKEYWRAKPKSQSLGGGGGQFPPLFLPLGALLPSQPPPPNSEPTLSQIPSCALPDALNKFSLLESLPAPIETTEDFGPPSVEKVNLQYPINRKRALTKVVTPEKVSTSGGRERNSTPPATLSPALAGQTTAKQPNNHHTQEGFGQDNKPSDNALIATTTTTTVTTAIAGTPGAGITGGTKVTTATNDSSRPRTENILSQEALEKRKLKRAEARKRRVDRKRARKGAAANAGVSENEGDGIEKCELGQGLGLN